MRKAADVQPFAAPYHSASSATENSAKPISHASIGARAAGRVSARWATTAVAASETSAAIAAAAVCALIPR